MNEQIEAIRNEIKRLQEIHERNLKKPMERGRIGYAHGVVACCDRILSFLDSLTEGPDNEESNRPKSSDNSLEDEMINYWGRIPEDKDLVDTARHFALWQKEQMMNEWLQDRDGCFWDGVEEGKKAMEKQMLKEAVEADVNTYELTPGGSAYVEFVVDMPVARFKFNDKVRIVIVKEEG